MRGLALWAAVSFAPVIVAQVKPPSSAPPATLKRYCKPEAGYCFRYPGSWSVLGEVFEGNGVVVAPAQKTDLELWNEVTVGRLIPAAGDNQPSPSLDDMIDQSVTALRGAGNTPETLERQQRTVGGKPAQMVRLRYHDKDNGHDWIEELVFIEGDEGEIYSVALKSALEEEARMHPFFTRILQSWTTEVPASSSASGRGIGVGTSSLSKPATTGSNKTPAAAKPNQP